MQQSTSCLWQRLLVLTKEPVTEHLQGKVHMNSEWECFFFGPSQCHLCAQSEAKDAKWCNSRIEKAWVPGALPGDKSVTQGSPRFISDWCGRQIFVVVSLRLGGGCSFYCSIDETSHTDEDTLKKKKKKFYPLLLFQGWEEVGAQLWLNLYIIIMYNHLNNLANQTNDPALNLLFPFKLGTSQDNISNTRYWSDHNFP